MRELVVIPIHNQKERASQVLRNVRQGYSGDILIVNDASTDGLGRVLAQMELDDVYVISHAAPQGLSASISTGLRFAARCGYDRVVAVAERLDPAEFAEGTAEEVVFHGIKALKVS